MSRAKSIKRYCLEECCAGVYSEVRHCAIESCPLHRYRFGGDELREKRELSESELLRLRESMSRARACRHKNVNEIEEELERDD